MAHIYAPFTEQQIEKLKEWQNGHGFHPFTCGGKDCKRGQREDEGELIPTTEGWVCPCGEYTQNWCHDFMVK